MNIISPALKTRQAVSRFLKNESGSMTMLSVVGIVGCCMVAGLAIDASNLYRQKEHLILAADSASKAGIVALSSNKSTFEVQTAALASAEQNIPASMFGKTSNGVQDIQLVRFDPSSRTVVSGTPNAVKVTLHRNASVENPVKTTLLRMVGISEFDFSVTSVAYYGQPGRCTSSDGIYAKGQVTLTSGNRIGESYCVHSQTAVWLPQQNTFDAGSGVSMPNLEMCKGKCVESANLGIEKAVFTMNLSLPKVADHIDKVTAAMLSTASDLKREVFANKPLASNLTPLSDAKILSVSATKNLVKGSVVSLTPAQYNDLMFNTSGNIPSGLVYNVDCRDRGNGPATSISIGGTKNRKNSVEDSSTIETIRHVVLITNCGFDVGANARIDNSLLVSTRISSSSVINADEGSVIGDPLKNCDINRKVYIMTMSGVSVNSNFTASNVALIVNGNINVAATSNSSKVEHNGTSMHAEGSIQIPSSHIFNSCAEDPSGLLPGMKTFKYVIPKS
ncbi:MAG: pilus assembly protein TadG-related protein [Pseudotabrizicola sp.]|uniref:TadE/TadG family type IV pilus assembly protein n=1 Tax=Pseudotabrizicola sp. TaxID=2939647 RepID=UPI00272FE20B|nr:TadE/TadG family type IV pilus assembly protein [Pseudotabrizicola sp.]MDP2081633.1 pilus assembly protein TadG-related protein [Pseudotabrizicola sp.]MDZ7575058.1 pilus assembly protein TadG-related protein [Pseudotabrizicola sp.]